MSDHQTGNVPSRAEHPATFEDIRDFAIVVAEALGALWLDGSGDFQDLRRRNTADQFALLGRLCREGILAPTAFHEAFGCLARVSRQPITGLHVSALSTTEYVVKLCEFIVRGAERDLRVHLARDDDLPEEERSKLMRAWPTYRKPYDNSGILPTYGRCLEMKTEIEWECQRVKTLPQLSATLLKHTDPGQSGAASAVPSALPPGASQDLSPYPGLAGVLHKLFWLAAKARKLKTDYFDQINPLTAPWDQHEQMARSMSASRGIPFTAFDPVLAQANEVLQELMQVAAGNEEAPFHALDPKYTKVERRLHELGMSYGGLPAAVPINTLVEFVKAAHQRPWAERELRGEDQERLSSLDADAYALCQQRGIAIPDIVYLHGKTYSPYGSMKIPLKQTTEGVDVYPDPNWLQAMKGLARAIEYQRPSSDLPSRVVATTGTDERAARGEGAGAVFGSPGGPKLARPSPSAPAPAIDLEAQAVALLLQQPEWSVTQIADELKVDRKTPYKWKKFREAAERCGKLKPRGAKDGNLRRGYKTRDGQVEAYAQEEDEDE